MGWGHGIETAGGCTAGHPSFPSREGLCSCLRPRWYSCFALSMNVDRKLGGTCVQIHMLTFLILTQLAGSIQAKIIFRKKENLNRSLRFPGSVVSFCLTCSQHSLPFHLSLLSTFPCSGTESSPYICIMCWHDITFFKQFNNMNWYLTIYFLL